MMRSRGRSGIDDLFTLHEGNDKFKLLPGRIFTAISRYLERWQILNVAALSLIPHEIWREDVPLLFQ